MRVFDTVVAFLLSLVWGVLLLGEASGKLFIGNLTAKASRGVLTGVGVLFLLIAFLIIMSAMRRAKKEPNVVLNNPQGEVRVAYSAIEDFIRKLGPSMGGVRELRPRVQVTGKGVEVTCRVTLEAADSIPTIAAAVQERIMQQLKETLGIDNVHQVRVHVSKILHPEGRKRGEARG